MKIVIAILIFGIIVLIHEFGHFVFARMNGIEVQDFSIGMGPRLCGFRAWGTQFSLRLLPLGGACMMLGEDHDQNMVDEHSFYAKNVWQRISVLFAGPGFNFLLAFIFSVVFIGMSGVDKPYVTKVVEGSPAAVAGMKEGDVITKINHSGVVISRDVQSYFLHNSISEKPITITVKRDGEKIKLTLTPQEYDKYMLGFSYSATESAPAEVLEVSEGYPMAEAGLLAKDVIIGIGDMEIKNSGELISYFDRSPLTAEPVEVRILRSGEEMTLTVTPKFVSKGYNTGFAYNMASEKVSAVQILRYSFTEVRFWIEETAKGLVQLFTGKLKSQDVGSVVAIVDLVGDTYEQTKKSGIRETILNLLYITIWISANVGVMNLLPIPALDGGKLLFCAIEVVRGKPVDREKEGMVHFIGFVLLMILMVFLIFNDVKNIFFTK